MGLATHGGYGRNDRSLYNRGSVFLDIVDHHTLQQMRANPRDGAI
jgi:hypothetical protein